MARMSGSTRRNVHHFSSADGTSKCSKYNFNSTDECADRLRCEAGERRLDSFGAAAGEEAGDLLSLLHAYKNTHMHT